MTIRPVLGTEKFVQTPLETTYKQTGSRLFVSINATVVTAEGIKTSGETKARMYNAVGQIWTKFTNLISSNQKQRIVRNKYVPLTLTTDQAEKKIVYVNVNSLMKHLQGATGSSREKLLNSYIKSKEQGEQYSEVLQNITSRGSLTKTDRGELMEDLVGKMAKDFQKSKKREENFTKIFDEWQVDNTDISKRPLSIDLTRTSYDSATISPEKYELLSSARMGSSGTATQGPEKQQSRKNWVAVDKLVISWAKNREPMTLERMNDINKGLCDGLKNNGGQAGQIRQAGENIRAGSNSYLAGAHVKEQMIIFDKWLTLKLEECDKGEANPVEVATQAFQRLVSIHPYPDGNGRTTRMVMDYILQRYNLPPCSIENPNLAIFGERQENVSAGAALKEVEKGIEKSCTIAGINSPFGNTIS